MNGHTRLAGPVQAAVIAALLGISVLIGTLYLRNPSLPERLVTKRPIQVEADGYVSSQACRSCHPSQYESWHGSFHRTMTQVATPETVRADFDGVTVNEVQDRPSRLQRRGDQFWADFDDPDSIGSGGLPRRIERQIVMITGSHQQQVYWYRTDQSRLLGELPGTYLIADKEWIPRRAAFMRPPNDHVSSETGRWNAVCINCHATHGKWNFDAPFGSELVNAQVADTTVSEFGIACEACHGPSERHVLANRNPLRRYELHLTGRPDPTTVLPVRVDPKLSLTDLRTMPWHLGVLRPRRGAASEHGRLPLPPWPGTSRDSFCGTTTGQFRFASHEKISGRVSALPAGFLLVRRNDSCFGTRV